MVLTLLCPEIAGFLCSECSLPCVRRPDGSWECLTLGCGVVE